MKKHYFIIILRNLIRNKTFSAINITGLAVGMACVILISQWVIDEIGFDTFHKNKENIYRIYHYTGNFQERDIETPAPLAPAIQNEIPEIVNYVRYTGISRIYFQYGDKTHYEDKAVFADGSLFEIFSFPVITGDPKTDLNEPFNIFISESIARKYFGDDDPIDKNLMIEGQYPGTVKGIFKDVPQNSSLDFNVVVSFMLTKHVGMDHCWGCFNFATYVQLDNNSNVEEVTSKVNQIAVRNKCPQVVNDGVKFHLQHISKIHLDASIEYEDEEDLIKLGNKTYVYIFSIVAALLLFLACANFINLSIAQSISRIKEVRIKKTIGANKRQVMFQFFGESMFLLLIALFIALIITELCLPWFNRITDKDIVIDYLNYKVILSLLLVYLISGLSAGFYPAFVLSSYNPAHAIKGRGIQVTNQFDLRKILITSQFVISTALIVCVLVFHKQLNYIQNKNLGFNKENIIYLPVKGDIAKDFDFVKEQLLRNPEVISVTIKNSLPVESMNNTSDFECDGKKTGKNIYFETASIGYDYFKTLNLTFKSGRAFSKVFPTDSSAFILNDEAVRLLELKDPVGKQLRLYRNRGQIMGVVQSAQFRSLHQLPRPRIYYFMQDYEEADITGVVLIKISGINIQQTISKIENLWKTINQSVPFEYGFLDEAIDNQYQFERKVNTIFNYFTILVIVVSVLGLFGLALYSTRQRTKEIGIRKANGAKNMEILLMLSKDFTKWVLLAFTIACPIAWFAMNKWLQNFAFRTRLSWWVFLAAGVTALIVALLTVSWQSWRAAGRNPVEALRYE